MSDAPPLPPLPPRPPAAPPLSSRSATPAKISQAQSASWAVALLTFVLLVLIGAIAFIVNHRQRSEPLAVATTSESPIKPEPSDAGRADRRQAPMVRESQESPAPSPEPKPVLPPKPDVEPPPEVKTQVQPSVAPVTPEAKPTPEPQVSPPGPPEAKPQANVGAKPEAKSEAKPEAKPETKPEAKSEAKPEAKPDPKPATAPVPAAADVSKAVDSIRDKYRSQYQAVEPEAKLKLIRQLVLDARSEPTDKPLQYALFSESLDVAVDVGAVRIFAQITKLVSDRFAVDPLKLKAEKLLANPRRARSVEANQALAKAALEVGAEALAAEQYEQAVRLGEAGREMARRAKDTARLKQAAALLREIIVCQETQAADLKAREVLASQPGDLRANLARGKYLCFITGDWAAGLPHLEKGADPVLRRLAEAEKTAPEGAAQMAALADQWWDAVKLVDEATQHHAKDRASWWYRKALPELTGPAKSRARKRLDDAEEAAGATRK